MTHPSTTSIPEQQQPPRSPRRAYGLLILIFRLLLLGVGGVLAWLVGMAIAQFRPAQLQNPPLVERARQYSATAVTRVRNLSPFGGTTTAPATPMPAPTSAESAAGVESTPSALTPAERQQRQTELNQLQTELQQLQSRTANLENQLGQGNRPSEPLESRLQDIQQQLNPNVPPSSNTTPATLPPIAATPTQQGNTLMVTLPSDALFAADNTTLNPQTQNILDAVVNDLRQYPGAAIWIAAYTDASEDTTRDRVVSFAQAEAVERYLSNALGDSYHWVAIGFGGNQPLVESTQVTDRQRNRRIEIKIAPQ